MSGTDSGTKTSGVATPGTLRPGTLIKETYRVSRFLGEGGAGAVYIAEHKSLGHFVAIKTLFSKFLRDNEMRRRFLEEAIIQANLSHPNIAKVTDVVDEGALCAIIMEYIDGSSLDRSLDKLDGPLEVEAAVRIMLGLLDGMSYAHTQGVVHRDIKPANILLATGNGGVQPKITDFGIAKVLSDHKRTETGTAMGTVYYASPEQLTDAKSVDHRADIYSLGCTFYELITGELPFDDDSMFGVMKKHVQAPRPDPRNLRPSLDPTLASAIMKAMAVDRSNRYQSCAEFAADIKRAANALQLRTSTVDIPLARAGRATSNPSSANPTHVAPAAPRATHEMQGRPAAPTGASAQRLSTPNAQIGHTSPQRRVTEGGVVTPMRRSTRGNTIAPPPKPRNPVSLVITGLIIAMSVGLVLFLATQLRSDDKAKDPLVTPSTDAGFQRRPDVDAPPEPADDQAATTPEGEGAPAAANEAPISLDECRDATDDYMRIASTSRISLEEGVEKLELAVTHCPVILEAAAFDTPFDNEGVALDVHLLETVHLKLQALDARDNGRDACEPALEAVSAAVRALWRINTAERSRRFQTFELNTLLNRRDIFAEQISRIRSAIPDCSYPSIDPEILGAAMEVEEEEVEQFDHAELLRQEAARRAAEQRRQAESEEGSGAPAP